MTLDDLADRLTDPNRGGIDGPLAVSVITSLAGGDRPSVDSLADALGVSASEVMTRLDAIPETEYAPEGDIVGHILTKVPTPTRIRLCDVQLYAWCPLDTLIVPPLLGRTAHVEGACGITGRQLSIVSAPGGALCAEASDLHVSLPLPEDITHLRSAFCQEIRFLVDAAAAHAWARSHPGCVTMTLRDAADYASGIAERLSAAALAPVSASPAPLG